MLPVGNGLDADIPVPLVTKHRLHRLNPMASVILPVSSEISTVPLTLMSGLE